MLNTDGFFVAGQEAYKAKSYTEGLEWFQRATFTGPNEVEAWFALSESYDQLDRPEGAVDAYQKAWKNNPDISTTALAICFRKKDDYQHMEVVLRDSLLGLQVSEQRL